MDFIANIPFLGGFLGTVLPFLVTIAIVVFVHEYGHYIVGRWCGIRATHFSLGFGPVLTKWVDRRGTQWQISALPLGGYVKFLGDADGSSRANPEELSHMDPETRAHSFHGAAIWRRMLTVLAGPVANFLLSIVVFSGLVMWIGLPTNDPIIDEVADLPYSEAQLLRPGDELVSIDGAPAETVGDLYLAAREREDTGPLSVTVRRDGERLDLTVPNPVAPLVYSPIPFTPADRAGLQRGDFIVSVDGEPIDAWSELQEAVTASEGRPLRLEVYRAGETFAVTLEPSLQETEDGEGGFEQRIMIGVSAMLPYDARTYTPGPVEALGHGVERTWGVITGTLNAIVHIFKGELSLDNLQGPIGLAQVSGKLAATGVIDFIFGVAAISTLIGLFNLFPIPVLDGGHLAIFTYEALAGRPPGEKVLQFVMTLGLGMVLLLMVFATYNDVMRLLSVS